MREKINLRLAGIAILAVFAAVIGITLTCYGLFQRQVRADLSVNAKLLRDSHLFASVSADVSAIDLSMESRELRVTWIDKDGNVLYDNDTSGELLGNHLNRPEIREAFANGTGEIIRRSDTMNEDTFYYAVLLDNGTVLRVAKNAKSIWSLFLSVVPVILLIVLCILALCIVISHMLTRQLLLPIETMARNLGNADYTSPYKELEPFSAIIKAQHADVLSAARARRDFTANVSHELKTPLTAISGYAELLGSMVQTEQEAHFCQEIRKNSDRLLALINDIIRLSELDQKERGPEFEKVDLYEAVSEVMEGLEIQAENRGVTLHFQGEPSFVHGNKNMLKELAENLIQNAIRYNNPNGRVDIMVRPECSRAAFIVKDNGIGIPASDQERVFERFYRVDKSRSKEAGGTGLGLAIVKHIVELHDGQIELDSAPGVGTTVTVRI